MISPVDIPINSFSWLIGAIACFALGIRSLMAYRNSYNLLTKYICIFSLIMGGALLCFSAPTLFTLNTDTLRYAWVMGELLVYASLAAQAAILWALVLRSKMSVYIPVITSGVI